MKTKKHFTNSRKLLFIIFITVIGVLSLINISEVFAQQKEKYPLYIDSVPRGLTIRFKTDNFLYETPFFGEMIHEEVEFSVLTNDVEFLAMVGKKIPERYSKWDDLSDEYNSCRFFQPVTTLCRLAFKNNQMVYGPIFKINLKEQNRVVALFIPKGEKISAIFPFMPPSKPFEDSEFLFLKNAKEGAIKKMLLENGFSEENMEEALESLSRIGMALDFSPSVMVPKKIRSITIQKQPLSKLINIHSN